MNEGVRRSDVEVSEFDASLIAPTERDWEIISSSLVIRNPRERCDLVADLAVLYPRHRISVPTQEDWDYFRKRTDQLKEDSMGMIVRFPLIAEMAKINREKAIVGFKPGELEILQRSLHPIIRGEESTGDYPASTQELLIYVDPEMTKSVFTQYGDVAWTSERRYLSELREKSPFKLFTLLAALCSISEEQTLALLEKSDFHLAQQGLSYYRTKAGENSYQIISLLHHLASLKKLTPLFEQLFAQDSSQFQ